MNNKPKNFRNSLFVLCLGILIAKIFIQLPIGKAQNSAGPSSQTILTLTITPEPAQPRGESGGGGGGGGAPAAQPISVRETATESTSVPSLEERIEKLKNDIEQIYQEPQLTKPEERKLTQYTSNFIKFQLELERRQKLEIADLEAKINMLEKKTSLTDEEKKRLYQYEKKLTVSEKEWEDSIEKYMEYLKEQTKEMEGETKLTKKKQQILQKYTEELFAAKERWKTAKEEKLRDMTKQLNNLLKKKKATIDDLLKRFKYKQTILKIEDDLLKAIRRDIKEYKEALEELSRDQKLTVQERQMLNKLASQMKTLEKEKSVLSKHRIGIHRLGLKVNNTKLLKKKVSSSSSSVRGQEEAETVLSFAEFQELAAEIDVLAAKESLSSEEEQHLNELEQKFDGSAISPQEYDRAVAELIGDAEEELEDVAAYDDEMEQFKVTFVLVLGILILTAIALLVRNTKT